MAQLKEIREWQAQHEIEDHERFGVISKTLTDIKDNHLAHMQAAAEETSKAQAVAAADMRWVKWLVMGLVSGIGAIIVGFLIWAATGHPA